MAPVLPCTLPSPLTGDHYRELLHLWDNKVPTEDQMKSKINAPTTHPRVKKIQVHTLDRCCRESIEVFKSLLEPHLLKDLPRGIDSVPY